MARIFLTGATGVLGQSAIRALLGQGHDVTGLVRDDDKASSVAAQGAHACQVSLFDLAGMTSALEGFDVVCNLVTHVPVGLSGMRRGAWKVNDRLRLEGSHIVAAAARAAGVRRLVQESVSFLYADCADNWITESSPLSVTRAAEPSAVAEANATDFAGPSRTAVILRFGNLVGDDASTRWRLAQARSGRPIGVGDPSGWTHVIHPDDVGSGVAAALSVPSGVYNVGAEPIRRRDLTRIFGMVAGRPDVRFVSRLMVRMAGERMELLTRSHRVSSGKLHAATGWVPSHDVFDASWLTGLVAH